jgi:putative peptidoglycan lipid II flippase
MFRNILSVGGLTLVSRILGLVRDIVIASLLGAGPVADAFFVAFRLPNHFRALFAEGAFNAAFVPLFSATLVRSGEAAARRFAEEVMALLAAVLVPLLAVALAVMPWLVQGLAPGFSHQPQQLDLAVQFTRITFPYLLFIALATLFASVLNGIGRFAAPAAAPILLNLSLITALLAAAPFLMSPGQALSCGVLAAGVLQCLFLAWQLRRAGVALAPRRPRLTPRVRGFLRVLGPVALGAGLTEINLLADTVIASWLPSGALSYLYYAERLSQLPLGVVVVAIGTVLLPEMARRISNGDLGGALERQNRAFELAMLLTLPFAAAYLVVGETLVSVLLGYGAFSTTDVSASAATLHAYAAGLPALAVLGILVTGFHANQDTATPVRVALVATLANLALKVALVGPLHQVGLALATSAAAWINVGLLALILRQRGLFCADAQLKRRLPGMVIATTGLALALHWMELGMADQLSATAPLPRIAAAATLLAGGVAVYGLLLGMTGAVQSRDLSALGATLGGPRRR